MAASGWSLSGNQLTTGDNVGIGTTNPAQPLHLGPGKALRIEGGTNPTDTADYFSFGGNGTFGIDAPGVPNGRFVVLNSGNVGIGTSSPSSALHLAIGKALRIEGGTNAADATDYFSFGGNGSFGIDAPGVPNGRFVVLNSGNVGVGTHTPASQLHVSGSAPGTLGPILNLTNEGGGENAAVAIDFNTYSLANRNPPGVYNPSSRIEASGHAGSFSDDLIFLFNQPGIPDHGLQEAMRVNYTGLQVSGNINVTGDVLLTGADCAEDFDVMGNQPPEPGTVVVIDESGALRESRQAYDTKVAGVVSGAGEYRHGLVLDKRSSQEGRIPVALMGKVYCKIDAEYSPVEVGDLLTTSPTPGHAMKAVDCKAVFGSVIGKALRQLRRGQDLIPILIALQ